MVSWRESSFLLLLLLWPRGAGTLLPWAVRGGGEGTRSPAPGGKQAGTAPLRSKRPLGKVAVQEMEKLPFLLCPPAPFLAQLWGPGRRQRGEKPKCPCATRSKAARLIIGGSVPGRLACAGRGTPAPTPAQPTCCAAVLQWLSMEGIYLAACSLMEPVLAPCSLSLPCIHCNAE